MSQTNFEILKELLEDNKDTEYGKKYHFSQINSYEDYKKQVPITDYHDYKPYVDRMYKGENNILTAYQIANFNCTSGTTGPQKLIPMTTNALKKSVNVAKKIVESISINKNDKEKTLYMGIFHIDLNKELERTILLSEKYYYSLFKKGIIDFNKYVDKDILFDPGDSSDYLYEKVWCGIVEENIVSLESAYMYGILQFLNYLEKNYKEIISDIRNKRISPEIKISEMAKNFLLNMKCSEERLNFVEAECDKGFKSIVTRIWPNFRVVSGVSTKYNKYQNDALDYFFGNVTKNGFLYGMSEGLMGYPKEYNSFIYCLEPTGGFYEFSPYSEDGKNDSYETVCINEIEPGKKYEIILTNFSGFYRYKTGDIIEIVTNDSKGVTFEYCFRKNRNISFAGEKTNCIHLEEAIKKMNDIIPNILEFKLGGIFCNNVGTYYLFLGLLDKKEVSIPLEEIAKKFDTFLSEANYLYGLFRKSKALAEPKVILFDVKEYNELIETDPGKRKHNKAQVLLTESELKEILENLKKNK